MPHARYFSDCHALNMARRPDLRNMRSCSSAFEIRFAPDCQSHEISIRQR